MASRNGVRERRRERIAEIVGRRANGRENGTDKLEQPGQLGQLGHSEQDGRFEREVPPYSDAGNGTPPASVPSPGSDPFRPAALDPDPFVYREPGRSRTPSGELPAGDPEAWWREREKRLKAGQLSGWEGLKSLPPTSSPPRGPKPEYGRQGSFARGFAIRTVVAAVAFGAVWGWTKLELPGSLQAKEWMVGSVTTDMDFRAIEAWYGDTFGGSPSFLPFGRAEPDTREVAALLDPAQTAMPVNGKIVESYAKSGHGVKIAAPGGSEVYAIFTGQVQRVTKDPEGGITVLVKHRNQVTSAYEGLESASVKPNDWVETGQSLGRLGVAGSPDTENVLVFATVQNGKTIDPEDVVSFD